MYDQIIHVLGNAVKTYDSKDYMPGRLDQIEIVLMISEMLNAGIVPFEDRSVRIDEILDSMTPAEARTYKRKFRKLWRKARREHGVELHSARRAIMARHAANSRPPAANSYINVNAMLAYIYGENARAPSQKQSHSRKSRVREFMWRTNVVTKLNEIAERAEK